MMGNAAVGST